jgi:hypothetical protein
MLLLENIDILILSSMILHMWSSFFIKHWSIIIDGVIVIWFLFQVSKLVRNTLYFATYLYTSYTYTKMSAQVLNF